LARTALERMHVNTMAGLQNGGVTGAYEIGARLALSNGVADGIAAIHQDLTSLDRTVTAGTVGLETLIQLAEGLRIPGPLGLMPIAALTGAPAPQTATTVNSRADLISGHVSGPAYSQSVGDVLMPQIPARAEVATPLPRSVPGLQQTNLDPEISFVPSLATVGAIAAQQHWPAASAMPASGTSVARVSPPQFADGATSAPKYEDAGAVPVDRPSATNSARSATPLGAVQNTEPDPVIAASKTAAPAATISATIAPKTAVPTTARSKDLPGIRTTLAFEKMLAVARSQEPLVTGSSAPPIAPPASQLPSVSPVVSQRAGMAGAQAMATDEQQPPAMSRQSVEPAAEPRQGLLILDGTLLGRWIMDRIARQASRPVAGTTGIDPRISPTFPGAAASV
jgi:hypothetical protein